MADSVEQVVYNYLVADSSFMSDFSGVHYIEAIGPQDYPYIVFWLVTDTGDATYLRQGGQGQARIQFDLWDDNKIRGSRLRNEIKKKVEQLNETRSGHAVTTLGVTEQTLQRASGTDPYHFVVDGTIQWQER